MNEETRRRLAAISERWNAVEKGMKEVELFRGEVILAAVNELRYTGRKIADALLVIVSGNNSIDVVNQHLMIAENYLNNADHDLTDSLILFILVRVSRTIERHGVKKILKLYPDFSSYSALLDDAKAKIVESRGNRGRRTEVYTELSNEHAPKLMVMYKALSAIRGLSVEDREVRRGLQLVSIVAFIGSVASIFSLFFAGWVWWTSPTLSDIKLVVSQAISNRK